MRAWPVVILVLAVGLAPARAQVSHPAAMPSSEQLLRSPVGGTHIPQQNSPRTLANPFEGDARAIAQGEALFKAMNCIGCHAPKGGGSMGPPLSDKAWIYGKEPSQVFLTIMQGRPNGMPAFGNALPEAEIWKLVAYVRTLSGPPGGTDPEPAAEKQSGKP